MPSVADLPHWNPLRRELLKWFDERVPGFAEGYVAAVDLVHRADFPARVHLVCHLVRDIYRYLPQALGDTSENKKGVEVYSNSSSSSSRTNTKRKPFNVPLIPPMLRLSMP
jgi:hypothetical protein